jgi:hypothetical protein
MNHLKTYKIFESYNDDEDFLNDVFLELEDIGYIIDIKKQETTNNSGSFISFQIEIKRLEKNINEDILSTIEMAVDYMLSKKYKYFIRISFFGNIENIEELKSYFNQMRSLINQPKREKITLHFNNVKFKK